MKPRIHPVRSFASNGIHPTRFFILPVVVLSLLAISYLRFLDNYELETLDLRFSLRPSIPVTDKVVLIEIGDDTIKNLGQWPIGRDYHALLIKALSQGDAKIILFDIFFSEGREYDDALAGAIREAKNVYLPFVFELDTKTKPAFPHAKGYAAKNLEIFSAADKGEGHINILPDVDGKFRRVPLLIRYNDGWYPYISFLAGCDYLKIPVKEVIFSPGRCIMCGDIKIPLEESSSMIINFSGKWGKSYKHYSYSDVIQSYLAPMVGQKPILDLGIFKDKICVVGLTAAGTVDLHPNPYEPLYPAFGIHAEMLNSMLNRKFIIRAPREWNLAILIALVILAALAILRVRPVKGLFILATTSFLFVLFGIILFDIAGIWIDLFYPVVLLFVLYLALTLYRYISEWKNRILLEKELGIARSIQESFLPKKIPEIEGLDAAAAIFTARQVGGDLYDLFDFGDKRLGVMIGDVSGKGIPASLFMAKAISEFKFFAASDSSPQDALHNLNSKIVKEASSNLFVTMFYIIFDMVNRKAVYSNGGHLAAIYLSGSKGPELLDTPEGTPLGLIDSEYSGKEMNFQRGDIFVLYSDGITEAMNRRSEMYGEKRLISVVKSKMGLTAKDLLKAIEKDVRNFESKASQHDDMTLIAIKIV